MPKAESPSLLGATPSLGAPGMEDWRLLVSKSRKGRDAGSLRSQTRDGIPIEPLYERRQNTQPLLGRGARPWMIAQAVDNADPDIANEQAIADIKGGAKELSIRFAGAPSAGGLGLPPTKDALHSALDGIDLADIYLWLEPHPQQLSTAVWTTELILASGIAPELANVSFGLDPVSIMAVGGGPAPEAQLFIETFTKLLAAQFFGPLSLLDARPYHEAGATEAQELGALLATAVWWLRALDTVGVTPEDAMPRLGASVCVDRDLYSSLAKIRALRLLWARLEDVCETERYSLEIQADTSRRMLTRTDPDTNLLRNTLAAFAAAAGSADRILVLPHTAALGVPDAKARALARNIHHLLMSEAHLGGVADPGAGSGAIETLTEALAERAWTEFQAIEREGGIVASLQSGTFQTRIADARAVLVEEVKRGRAPLVGSTLYAAERVKEETTVPVMGLPGLAPISLEALARSAG